MQHLTEPTSLRDRTKHCHTECLEGGSPASTEQTTTGWSYSGDLSCPMVKNSSQWSWKQVARLTWRSHTASKQYDLLQYQQISLLPCSLPSIIFVHKPGIVTVMLICVYKRTPRTKAKCGMSHIWLNRDPQRVFIAKKNKPLAWKEISSYFCNENCGVTFLWWSASKLKNLSFAGCTWRLVQQVNFS